MGCRFLEREQKEPLDPKISFHKNVNASPEQNWHKGSRHALKYCLLDGMCFSQQIRARQHKETRDRKRGKTVYDKCGQPPLCVVIKYIASIMQYNDYPTAYDSQQVSPRLSFLSIILMGGGRIFVYLAQSHSLPLK